MKVRFKSEVKNEQCEVKNEQCEVKSEVKSEVKVR